MEIVRTKNWQLATVVAFSLLPLLAATAISHASPAFDAAHGQQATDKSAPPAPPRPVRVIADLTQFHLDQIPRKKQNDTGAGSRGAVSTLTLCAPSSGAASSTRPLFEWRAPDSGASKVTFSLLNDGGDVLYESDVAGTRFEYPADAPALQPGQAYSWKVTGGQMNRLPEAVAFTLQTESERAALQGSLASASDPLAHAQVYLKNGLWYDSVAALQSGIQKFPERKDLQEQLAKLYEQVAPACSTR